ncbi:Splicing factor_ arginine/serinerich 16, partial [Caligus rogercresseyi]
ESLESGKPGSNTSALNGSASKSKSDTVKAKIQRKLQAQLKKQCKSLRGLLC